LHFTITVARSRLHSSRSNGVYFIHEYNGWCMLPAII
jgi:hypothetical protein